MQTSAEQTTELKLARREHLVKPPQNRVLPTLLLLCGFAVATAHAQDVSAFRHQVDLIKAPEANLKLGNNLFGDQINLYTGSVSFKHTDVSLRGNDALDMSIGRRLTVGSRVNGRQFGNWTLDLPHIRGTYSATNGWINFAGNTQRCSNFSSPPAALGGGAYWGPSDYWSGVSLSLPSGEDKRLLRRASNFTLAPGAPASYPVVTNDHWTFECLPSLANASAGALGEGFVAVSPQGTRYTFNWLVTFVVDGLMKVEGGRNNYLQRKEVWLLPTLVTDRFGNTVRYTYDPARQRNLTRMEASDGRVLTLTYEPTGYDRIKTVSDGTRTWTYSYSGPSLDTVTLPDSSTWKLAGLQTLLANVETLEYNKCGNPLDVTPTILTGSLKHPSGATGSYTLAPIRHGRTDVPAYCQVTYTGTKIPKDFYTNTLTSRTISGPGMADMTWTYEYTNPSSWRPCGTCGLGKTVVQRDPAGHATRYTYGNRFEVNEGKLLKEEHGWDGVSALRTVTTRYKSPIGAAYPEVYGTTEKSMGDAGTNIRNMPVDERVTTQQGVNFTWQGDDFDVFMRPKQVTRVSSVGIAKTEATVFSDHYSKWVLGQVEQVTEVNTGKVSVANTYNGVSANLETTASFGKLQSTLAYYADGTLLSRKDGRGLVTTYSAYKRGIPQKVTYADSTSQSLVVNNTGTIASVTDASGATTAFGYDAIGRLASVIHPTSDSVAWNPTSITYSYVGAAEYDIGAGHWRMMSVTGNANKRILFDALWRPVYAETWDSADVAGTVRVTKHQYDFGSRPTFQSYPKRTVAELAQGVRHEYDALGRPTITETDSELGILSSNVRYNDGFTTVHSNARQFDTTFSYQTFDEPVETAIVNISAPEGVSTVIARDIFGKPTAITRSGGGKSATRSYVYDGHERLCKTIEPETGATVQDYDQANNIAWRASGLALLSTGSCDTGNVPAAKRMAFGYDNQNKLLTTTFGDASPSITRTYTADGLPLTISSNGAVWTNSYNKRRLNERENLAYGGVTYNIDRLYDANASLQQIKYPVDNLTLAYNPNALGEPRQVGSYASAISYHPSGAIASFRYGNGIVHSMAQNMRGLPERSTDVGVLDDRYTYDQNANVTGIADFIAGSVTGRTMTYDGLDRLASTAAPNLWGTAGYTYDALDNLTSSTISAGGTARTSVHNIDPTTNRLTSIVGTAPYNFSYGYDDQGNIVQRGAQTYVFDQGNRMTLATGKATYGYDGLGHRFTMVGTDGVNRVQVYSQEGQLLYGGPTGSIGTKYVFLHKHVIAEVDGNGVKYSHTDGLGSPVVQTDSFGAVVNRTRYEPYGLVAAGAPKTIGFTGHVNDSDTGLTYMQQRYYDPVAGRMLSIDPVTTDANTGEMFNRYNYAYNNPYKYVDPDGRWGVPGAVFGAVAGAVGGFVASGGTVKERVIGTLAGAAAGGAVGFAAPQASHAAGFATAATLAVTGVVASAAGQATGSVANAAIDKGIGNVKVSDVKIDPVTTVLGGVGAGTGGLVGSSIANATMRPVIGQTVALAGTPRVSGMVAGAVVEGAIIGVAEKSADKVKEVIGK